MAYSGQATPLPVPLTLNGVDQSGSISSVASNDITSEMTIAFKATQLSISHTSSRDYERAFDFDNGCHSN